MNGAAGAPGDRQPDAAACWPGWPTNPKMNNPEKIRYLYLAAFARRPTKPEIALSNELLAARDGDVGAALQDIWWALLNSNEFILIH